MDDGVAMPDYELLELILFSAIPRRDTKPLVKRLIAREPVTARLYFLRVPMYDVVLAAPVVHTPRLVPPGYHVASVPTRPNTACNLSSDTNRNTAKADPMIPR
ncbi:MAG: hypothetical protein VW453_09845, partial [Rhodospirillaceae bacterium]